MLVVASSCLNYVYANPLENVTDRGRPHANAQSNARSLMLNIVLSCVTLPLNPSTLYNTCNRASNIVLDEMYSVQMKNHLFLHFDL